jgi:hypothetical protein
MHGEEFGVWLSTFVNDFFHGNSPAQFTAKTRAAGAENAHLVAETAQNTTVKKLLRAVA